MRAAFGLMMLGAGCGPVGSEGRDTDRLRVDAEVVLFGESAGAVGVSLFVNRPWRRGVTLEDGDELWTDVDGVEKALSPEPDGRRVVYAAYYSDLGAEAQVQVGLDRGGDVFSETFMSVPEPFVLDELPSQLNFRFDDLVVSWSPPAEERMVVTIEGRCISNLRLEVEAGTDDGVLRIPAGEIDVWDTEDASACAGTVTVRRERDGTLDPSFRTGGAVGVQSRVSDVFFNPW